jgi:hypothetical protein
MSAKQLDDKALKELIEKNAEKFKTKSSNAAEQRRVVMEQKKPKK